MTHEHCNHNHSHEHDHAHTHEVHSHAEHHHGHHHASSGKNLALTIVLNIFITLAQVVGSIFSGSLALMSDALHNFSDVMALVIAWWAKKISSHENSEARTFGYKRAEIVAALFNASVLVGIGVYLIVEGIGKFFNPESIDSDIVIYLALLGIVLNAASVLLIKDDAHDNLNMKAAYLHLLTDVMTSIAVLAGGLGMKYFGLFWIDPLISILIAFYLMYSSFGLIKQTVAILMQFSPSHVSVKAVEAEVMRFSELDNLHHVHLWQLNDQEVHLEAHLDFKEDLPLSSVTHVVMEVEKALEERLGITHVTLQAEFNKRDQKELIYNHEKGKENV